MELALPNVRQAMTHAMSEVDRLEKEKQDAVVAYLRQRADDVAEAYKKIFAALCATHDTLAGISVALSTTGAFGGEIQMSTVPMQVPRFNLPALADPNEYLPTMTHRASEITVDEAMASWMAARERLANDADAPLDDLLGPQAGD
jgi:hypothetical protein